MVRVSHCWRPQSVLILPLIIAYCASVSVDTTFASLEGFGIVLYLIARPEYHMPDIVGQV